MIWLLIGYAVGSIEGRVSVDYFSPSSDPVNFILIHFIT